MIYCIMREVGRMSRPAKPASTKKTSERKASRARAAKEAALKGGTAVSVPQGLTKRQEEIAAAIISGLSEADILSSLDETVLKMAAFSIDGIDGCIREQNDDPDCMNDSNFRQKMKRYEETFATACKELGLSPQARAKLAIAAQNKDTSLDEIRKAIGG